jgi:hypothetical protein
MTAKKMMACGVKRTGDGKTQTGAPAPGDKLSLVSTMRYVAGGYLGH